MQTFDELDMMTDEDRLRNTATVRSDNNYEIVDYYLQRMLNGAFDKDTIYRYIYYSLVEMKNLRMSMLVPVVVVNLIVNKMITIAEIEEEISSWSPEAHPRDVEFYRLLLGFLFRDVSTDDLVQFIGTETPYIKGFMDCSSVVSVSKVRECATAFVEKYGCETVFDVVYVSRVPSPGWRLLSERSVFEICDIPMDPELMSNRGAIYRLEEVMESN